MEPVSERYVERPPVAPLFGLVECFWTARGTRGGTARILADGCADLLFSRDDGTVTSRIIGTMQSAVVVGRPDNRDLVAVRFSPGGARALLGLDMRELVDQAVPAAEVLPAMRIPTSSLTGNADSTITVIERWLLSRMNHVNSNDLTAARYANACASRGTDRIGDLAAEIGVSRQHLRRVVLRATGIGPKRLARIGRVRRAAEALSRGHHPDARTALDANFYDQSHMVNEFQALVGITPGAYAETTRHA